MKTKILLAFFALLLSTFVISQNTEIELSFEAEYNGENVVLDIIFIENLTQGGDTTLYYPDDEFIWIITDIDDKQSAVENNFSVSQNYPNPFNHQTQINLYLPGKENIIITVHDILGRELASFKNTLKRGNHTFTFSPGNDKYYLLTVTGKRGSKTIKMLNVGNDLLSNQQCQIIYTAFHEGSSELKSLKSINEFVFEVGDTLRFTGYSNTPYGTVGTYVIVDAPEVDTLYTFDITEGIRCPGITIITDIEGNTYHTVQIGTQCWMQENLKTTKYRNGTAIPNITNDSQWSTLASGAYAWYDNDISWKDIYYALYNGYTVLDTNGICPSGWHVPSDAEWTEMTDFIGGLSAPHGNELKSCRQVNYPLGSECNTTEHPRWDEDPVNYGTNDYGFNAIPGGMRWYYGTFDIIGIVSGYWTSTVHTSTHLWNYGMGNYEGAIIRDWGTMKFGTGVRCVKD